MTHEDYQDCPSVWFAELEAAIRNRDKDRAVSAERNLTRLGFTVTIPPSNVLDMQTSEVTSR